MPRSLLVRQLSRVRRRLFLAQLLHVLLWSWVVALVVAAGWIVGQPHVWPAAAAGHRIAVAGLVLAASALALIVAGLRRPSVVAAALTLDDRLGMQERVTTALTLAAHEASGSVGQALLADVEAQLAAAPVAARFPVALPRLPLLLLAPALLAVVLLGLWYDPRPGGTASADDPSPTPVDQADLERQMQHLAANRPARKPDEPPASEELQRIEAEVERFARQPRDSRDEVRERVKDATALEEEIRRRQKEQADRLDALREAMKQTERLKRKERGGDPPDGPGRAAADAVARGDLDRAADELQRLSRRLENEDRKERLRRKSRNGASAEERRQAAEELEQLDREQNLTQKERDALAKQLEEMEDALRRLSRSRQEQEKELADQAERGEIDREQLDREMDQLAKNAETLEKDKKQIREMAEQLGECKQCVGEGKDGEAAGKLAKAARQAGQLGKDGEAAELARRLGQVRQVKQALCRSLGNQAGQAAGRRPEQKDDATAAKDVAAPGEWDRGKLEAIGRGPLGGFKGPRRPAEMQPEIRQAAREAPAAIDRQRLPSSARKMARGYFEKVRGAEPAKK